MSLLRYIPIWRRNKNGIVLYRCFEIIGGNGFTVQSADHFTTESLPTRMPELEKQFLELLAEQSPEERFPLHPSIESAIAAFDAEFGNEYSV
ncbi:hypothetical protein [Pseudomonas sp. JZ134]|uniref:hypothetical protein n=1 Tax=Pseudomonas sp. JZ134 TaxID=2806615 RepID=UPI003DA165C0